MRRIWNWTDFSGKLGWEWLGLLGIPLVIGMAAGLFSVMESKREDQRVESRLDFEILLVREQHEIEADRARQVKIDAIKEKLAPSDDDDDVAADVPVGRSPDDPDAPDDDESAPPPDVTWSDETYSCRHEVTR